MILHRPLQCVLHHVSSTLLRTECTNHSSSSSESDNGQRVRFVTVIWNQTPDLPLVAAPEPQHPHPFAPADLQKSFQEFLSKFKSSGTAPSSSTSQAPSSGSVNKQGDNVVVFSDFWQAPEKLWKRQLSEEEIEVITVCADCSSHVYSR